MAAKQFWLLKTEPESFSFDDLVASPGRTTFWDGVRNYQARNFLRAMRRGDEVLIYHSNADPPAAVGIATVVKTAAPDPTQFDPNDHHYDAGSDPRDPRWDGVTIRAGQPFPAPLGLPDLRAEPGLAGMELLRKGSRLSVQPVSPAEWATVLRLAKRQKGTK